MMTRKPIGELAALIFGAVLGFSTAAVAEEETGAPGDPVAPNDALPEASDSNESTPVTNEGGEQMDVPSEVGGGAPASGGAVTESQDPFAEPEPLPTATIVRESPPVTAELEADPPQRRLGNRALLGPAINLGLGANMLFCDSDGLCDEALPLVGLNAHALWRFNPFIAAELGMDFGFVLPDGAGESDEVSVTQYVGKFLVGARTFIPVRSVDINFGFAIGYGRNRLRLDHNERDGSVSFTMSGMVLAVSQGFDFWIGSHVELGFRWQLAVPFYSKFCEEYNGMGEGGEYCETELEIDFQQFELRAGLALTVYLAPRRFARR